MDIKQLNYFMAVAQAGSFSKAAENLTVSQPTLSVAVKKLEEELGVRLFYSFNREQRLTDEGLRLMNGARRLMDVYQQTVASSGICCRALPQRIPISTLRSWRTAPTELTKK